MFRNQDPATWVGIISALILTLGLVQYVMLRFQSKGVLSTRFRRTLAWVAEFAILLVVVALSLAWVTGVRHPFGLLENPDNLFQGPQDATYAETALASASMALAGLVLLSRLPVPAIVFQLLAVAWIGGGSWMLLLPFKALLDELYGAVAQYPKVKHVLPELMLPGPLFQTARLVLWALVPFLAGVYCVRHKFAWWKFLSGSLLTGWALSLILMPIVMTVNYWLVIQPLIFTTLGALLLLLPLQSLALERLFGISLRILPATDVTARVRRPAAAVLGHFLVMTIAVCLAVLCFAGFIDRRQIEAIIIGPRPIPRSTSHVNAYPILKAGKFLKGQENDTPWADIGSSKSLGKVILIAQGGLLHDVRDEEGWKRYDIDRIREGLRELSQPIDVFTSASQCDYLELPPREKMISFLAARETARAIHTRCMVAIRENDTTSALKDISIIASFGGMIKDYPNLVVQLISLGIRSIALEAAYQYFKAMRANPAAMVQLAKCLDDQRENLSSDLNYHALRHGEPGFFEICTNAEMMIPAFVRAWTAAESRHAQYQQLVLACALEQHRGRYGRYPERLEQLVPEYINRVPLDPFEGLPYVYAPAGSDFTLSVKGAEKLKQHEEPFQFPVPSVEQVNMRKRT